MYSLTSWMTLIKISHSHVNVINLLTDSNGLFHEMSSAERYETIRSFVLTDNPDNFYFRSKLSDIDNLFLYDTKINIDEDGFKLSGKRFDISINGKHVMFEDDTNLDFWDTEDHLFKIFCSKFDVRETDIETITVPKKLDFFQKLCRVKQKDHRGIKTGHYVSKDLKQKVVDGIDDYQLYGKQIQLHGFKPNKEVMIYG